MTKMVHRRVGKSARFAKKRKLKISDRLLSSADVEDRTNGGSKGTGNKPNRKGKSSKKAPTRNKKDSALSAVRRRSLMLKRHAAERMALKEHLTALEEKRRHIRKGEDAKLQRRELGKYIRKLMEEQAKKHETELVAVQGELRDAHKRVALETNTSVEAISEIELKNMFAHLLQ